VTAGQYWLQTLGCPKNQVDSDKLAGTLVDAGFVEADRPEAAELVVVNTCAFIEEARQESVEAVLELAGRRRPGARLVVTGCLAERYGQELAAALPEADLVAGFGVPLTSPGAPHHPSPAPVPVALRSPARAGAGFDLLELPRPPVAVPWAYVKVAEGCDRACGFCAIPSFRGPQRSRSAAAVLAEIDALRAGPVPVHEIVLVAQDLASFGRDRSDRRASASRSPQRGRTSVAPIVDLVRAVSEQVPWTRLLYLYPSQLTGALIEAVLATSVPYFDLSLQHVSPPLLRAMRRPGGADRFLDRIAAIRRAAPDATFRSSFILGYPGETERDHDLLLAFLEEAQLDWAGFFPFSHEVGTHAAALVDQVPAELAMERLRECGEIQDAITARRRDAMVGQTLTVLVERPGRSRSVHEAPEIDGIIRVPADLEVGAFASVRVTASLGPDLEAVPVAGPPEARQNAAMPRGATAP